MWCFNYWLAVLQLIINGTTSTAILSFTNITVGDEREYYCITIHEDFSSSINTITVIVDPGT